MTRYEEVCAELRANRRLWLITGVAGFIGSNLLETLLKLDQRVVGLDNFATGYQRNLDEVKTLVEPSRNGRGSNSLRATFAASLTVTAPATASTMFCIRRRLARCRAASPIRLRPMLSMSAVSSTCWSLRATPGSSASFTPPAVQPMAIILDCRRSKTSSVGH